MSTPNKPFDTIQEVDDYLSGDKIRCLICGRKYKALGIHISQKHRMDVDDYRSRFGIPWTYGLVCKSTREIQREQGKALYKHNIGSENLYRTGRVNPKRRKICKAIRNKRSSQAATARKIRSERARG